MLTKKEKQEIKKFYKTLSINQDIKESITKKALFQLVWREDWNDYQSSFRPIWETEDCFHKTEKLCKDKKVFDYETIKNLLETDESKAREKRKRLGYTKHKIALYDPETKDFLFSIRYDLGAMEKDSLENAMLYGNLHNPLVKKNYDKGEL